jgi:uncharacterized protein YajQ (UPF0234 family)
MNGNILESDTGQEIFTRADIEKTRAETREQTENEFFALFGVGDKDGLLDVVKARGEYERNIQKLQERLGALETAKDEGDYVVAAMEALTGIGREETGNIVKMIKGVAGDGTPIEEAVRIVAGLNAAKNKEREAAINSLKPETPDVLPEGNPFDFSGGFNLTEQGRIFMENPKAARGFFKRR